MFNPGPDPAPRAATERVLPTLNVDGSRRWLTPTLSPGRFYRARLVTAWALMALFALLPHARIGGRPAMLLDVVHRRFTLFGATFYPTETMLLMLLLVGIFVGIFLLTAVLGRVWCGWACPQTVYMEFLYRPIERAFARLARGAHARAARGWRALRLAVYLGVSMVLAHTFLAYFVGVEALAQWVRRSPLEHPVSFLVMAGTTALMFLDFGYFREQICMVACPYGRLQSVLLDRRSLIVGYDARRGEPRGKLGRVTGDCVDCGACVRTCPTGIDIRDGLQMECIHCTQCIDACDAIMDRIGKPRGLIRYSSRDELAGAARRILRPRIVLYPALLVLVWGALAWALVARPTAEVTVLRGLGEPFTVLRSGEVSNQIRVKIENHSGESQRYWIELLDGDDLHLVAPDNPVTVGAGHQATATLFVLGAPSRFPHGSREVRFRVSDGGTYTATPSYRLLGPSEGPARDAASDRKAQP